MKLRHDTPQDLLAACIWSRWWAPGKPDLLSFAIITHDPPPEVAAVGHDRCIVPISPEDLDAWLQPPPLGMGSQNTILDRALLSYFSYSIVGARAGKDAQRRRWQARGVVRFASATVRNAPARDIRFPDLVA